MMYFWGNLVRRAEAGSCSVPLPIDAGKVSAINPWYIATALIVAALVLAWAVRRNRQINKK